MAVLIALAGCATGPDGSSAATSVPVAREPEPTAGPPEVASRSALAAVASLPVKGRGPRTGYSRKQFGQAWADTDRNGCDTRNDVLRRDLRDVVLREGTGGCVVLNGQFIEPYTGRQVTFSRSDAGAVQIDHVVSLSDAWQKGAAGWDPARRLAFANDPLDLLATDGPTNQAKSDGDTATWLPPNTSFRCSYVARQVAVKAAYDLSVTVAERDAMLRVLRRCAGEARSEPSPPASSASTTPAEAVDPGYGSCAQVKAHGAGPYVRGQPEYEDYRDGDGDGTVCE